MNKNWAAMAALLVTISSCSGGSDGGKALSSTAPGDSSSKTSTVAYADSKYSLWTGGAKLRGANIWVTRSYNGVISHIGDVAVGPKYTQSDFDNLARLGANYVNISHAGIYTESPPFQVDADAQASLDNILEMISEADMFAVICFRTGPGRSEFTFSRGDAGTWFRASLLDETVWTDQAKQDAWTDMWSYTAKRYQDNPVVVGYGLMVEPNGNMLVLEEMEYATEPVDFYSSYSGTLYDWNSFYPRIVEAIRSVDTKTPIFVEPMGYGSVKWVPYLQKSDAERIVYAVHQYEPDQYTHQSKNGEKSYPGEYDVDYDGSAEEFNNSWLDDLLSTVDDFASNGEAVVVNEFGIIRWTPNGADYIRDLFDLFEERGWSHALWLWRSESLDVNWFSRYAYHYDEFDFMHGPDPSNHTDVASSDLITVITGVWSQNTLRPSNTDFTAYSDPDQPPYL